MDYSQTVYAGSANAFKNDRPKTATLTLSGTVGAGATRTFSTTVTLDEDQAFAYAVAKYLEFAKWAGGSSASKYQLIPTFRAYVETTPVGFLNTAIYFRINGNVVTFIAAIYNPYGGTETITTTNISISYITYTLAK